MKAVVADQAKFTTIRQSKRQMKYNAICHKFIKIQRPRGCFVYRDNVNRNIQILQKTRAVTAEQHLSNSRQRFRKT